jgi:hypothetical protein
MGSPNFKLAPSLWSIFGIVPKKSSGFIAKVLDEVVLSNIFSALPLMLRFAPLLERTFLITSIKLNSKSYKFNNYTSLEKTNNK